MASSQDIYGTYGSVRQTAPQTQSPVLQSTYANPNMFGAEMAQNIQKAGEKGQEYANEQIKTLQEADVNNVYATQYIPQALELKRAYDGADDATKPMAYQQYVTSLSKLGNDIVQNQGGDYSSKLLGSLINNSYRGFISNASSGLEESNKMFAADAANKKVDASVSQATALYNQPGMVDGQLASVGGTSKLKIIDSGGDINTPEAQEEIRIAQGKVVDGALTGALSSGDIYSANSMKTQYAQYLTPEQHIKWDNALNMENARQNSVRAVNSFYQGKAAPEPSGFTPLNVQSTIVSTAQNMGIDHNDLLAVAQVESSMGKNLGTRGDIGQTGKGGSLENQSVNMANAFSSAKTAASDFFGREAYGAEAYVCYQQGNTGGTALFKAGRDNPSEKAVDVLFGVYGDYSKARKALIGNGGSLDMTANDFTKYLMDKFNSAKDYVSVDAIPNDDRPLSQQMVAAQSPSTPPLQNLSNPVDKYNDWASKYPMMLDAANSDPNRMQRELRVRLIEENDRNLKSAATSYNQYQMQQALKFAEDPSFTNLNMLNSGLLSDIKQHNPEGFFTLQAKAKENLEAKSKTPLVFDDTLPSQLSTRANTIMTPEETFKDGDRQKLKQTWSAYDMNKQVAFLQQMKEGSLNSASFVRGAKLLNSENSDFPIAASLIGMNKQSYAGTQSTDVGRMILEGINKRKSFLGNTDVGGMTGLKGISTDFDTAFKSSVGNLFRNDKTRYETYRDACYDYYIGKSMTTGNINEKLDDNLMNEAIVNVVGQPVNMGGGWVKAPWGQSQSEFVDNVNSALQDAMDKHMGGLKAHASDFSLLETDVPGKYYVTQINDDIETPMHGANGGLIYINTLGKK